MARWFTSEGRARAAEVPALPLGAAALDWGGAYLALFLGPGTALLGTMKRMFDETGIRLGWTTELVFVAVYALRAYGYLLVPAAAALVAVLLVKGPATPRRWVLAAHALGAALLVGTVAGLVLPIVELLQKL